MDAVQAARAYYRAIDADEYEALTDLLASGFVHSRPDRTIESREAFVRFMREGRPVTDTTHVVEAVYEGPRGVAVRGTLSRDDDPLFGFVDVFAWDGTAFEELTTYVRT